MLLTFLFGANGERRTLVPKQFLRHLAAPVDASKGGILLQAIGSQYAQSDIYSENILRKVPHDFV
jgi:hypothetical protein